MSKLIAIHMLHLVGAVAGQPYVVEPGEGFHSIPEDNEERLLGIGAARKATKDDTVPFPDRPGAKAEDGPVDISKMNKEKLLEVAKAEQVELKGDETVAQLKEAIEAARAAKNDDSLV